ncbi:MAG: protein translocase subunit SecF [Firmicutes bacterium]|nr:protein translocase subunit SecF [Bacillota bacterium]
MGEKIKNFTFMKYRKIYYIIAVVLIIVSMGFGLIRGFNFGIDFTGGTLIQIEMEREIAVEEIYDVMAQNEITGSVTHAGEGNTQIIIKTPDSMESGARESFVDAMSDAFGITEDSVLSVENIGPSVGETLKTGAVKAVAAAVVLMLIYIAIRFMWKYGVAAIIALCVTLLVLFGFYGVFHITINSPFIAAMLTILGYGINDTIVIFDRIRENLNLSAKKTVNSLDEIVDDSIRQTIGRSVMTSLTTIAVMVPLLIFCGNTIRSFILPLLVGVISSTLCSIFIATSVWYDICRLTDTKAYKGGSKSRKKSKKAAKSA